MNHDGAHTETAVPRRSRPLRWLLAGLGIACVGAGAAGVFLPGLPTTVFLLAASWLFARSCPWLEERLIRVPLFRPFLGYLRPGAAMPRRAVVATLALMWGAIAVSAGLLLVGASSRPAVAATVVAAGLVGTVFVVRLGRRTTTRSPPEGTLQPRAGLRRDRALEDGEAAHESRVRAGFSPGAGSYGITTASAASSAPGAGVITGQAAEATVAVPGSTTASTTTGSTGPARHSGCRRP